MKHGRDVVFTLNHLIETCRNGEAGFRLSADRAADERHRALFERYSVQRSDFASELEGRVRGMGVEPATKGTWTGAAHRRWLSLRSALDRGRGRAILAEVERGEDVAKRNYQEALREDLPPEISRVVEQQYAEVQEAHDRIRSLRARTG